MRNPLHLAAILALTFLISCSTVDAPILEEEDDTVQNPETLVELVNTAWYIVNCSQSNEFLLDGYTECEYFQWISFSMDRVYVRHAGNPNLVNHFLCDIDGDFLTMTRQGCGFVGSPNFIELKIVSYDETAIQIGIKAPNLNPNFSRVLTFAKVN